MSTKRSIFTVADMKQLVFLFLEIIWIEGDVYALQGVLPRLHRAVTMSAGTFPHSHLQLLKSMWCAQWTAI